MMNKWIISVTVALASCLPSHAQQHLSLKEALEASGSSNSSIRLSRLDVQVAKAKLRQADASFLPLANFSYSSATSNNPLNAFGFKLQQESITAMDFNPKQLNNPSSTTDFSTKFELQQPILNLDMFYQRKAASKQSEVAALMSDRMEEFISYQTTKSYLRLQMIYEENKTLNDGLITSKAVYKISNDYFNQGLIQKSDLLNTELHVMNIETQINSLQSAMQDASDILSILMDQPTGTLYTVDSLNMTTKLVAQDVSFLNERSDFKAMQKGIESFDMLIKSSRMSYLPHLNGVASYQWNDKHVLGFKANSYFAGVQLSWNIFNGNRTKNVIYQQRFEQEKLGQQLDQQKKEAQMQIDQSKRQLADAAYEMKRQELGIEQASEALRVLQNRYAQGLTKTSDVLLAVTQLSQQRLGYVQAVFDYNVATATLQFLTVNK